MITIGSTSFLEGNQYLEFCRLLFNKKYTTINHPLLRGKMKINAAFTLLVVLCNTFLLLILAGCSDL